MVSARRKAVLFSTALIATSALFLVNAAASTEGFLRPLRDASLEFPQERGLSRHTAALAVVVSAVQGNSTARVEGASVEVLRENESQASDTTDADGRALFHLRRGAYILRVAWGDLRSEEDIRLREDQRQSVFFDEEGVAHWGKKAHRDLEKERRDAATLLVRLRHGGDGLDDPISGANVTVFRPADDEAQGREPVASGATDERGTAFFSLHRGMYVVEVQWSGGNATTRVQLCGETKLLLEVEGEGEVEPRVDGSCNKGPHHERESRGRGRDEERAGRGGPGRR